MKRYKIQTNYSTNCTARMEESDGGEWIRYSDYVKEKEEIKKKRIEFMRILGEQLIEAEMERLSYD